jgi:hypothetical protein
MSGFFAAWEGRREPVYVAQPQLRSLAAKLGVPTAPEGSEAAVADVLEPLASSVAARGRAATDLVAGQWIWFDEPFRAGAPELLGEESVSAVDILADRVPRTELVDPGEDRFVFFAADQRPPLVLCGAREHLLDERCLGDDPGNDRMLYASPFFRYAREVIGGWVAAGARQPAEPVRRPDETVAAAIDRFDTLHRSMRGFAGPVRVRGLARVAGVLASTGRRSVVAVPLCAEAEAP